MDFTFAIFLDSVFEIPPRSFDAKIKLFFTVKKLLGSNRICEQRESSLALSCATSSAPRRFSAAAGFLGFGTVTVAAVLDLRDSPL